MAPESRWYWDLISGRMRLNTDGFQRLQSCMCFHPCAPWAELPCSGGFISTGPWPHAPFHTPPCSVERLFKHILHMTFHALLSDALTYASDTRLPQHRNCKLKNFLLVELVEDPRLRMLILDLRPRDSRSKPSNLCGRFGAFVGANRRVTVSGFRRFFGARGHLNNCA